MTENRYNAVKEYFSLHPLLMSILNFFYKFLPFIVKVSYVTAVCILIYNFKELPFKYFFKIVIIPATVFIAVTVFRKLLNFERPYEKYNITPLIHKDKKGQSFPSRHTASSFIIAMAFLYINPIIGIIYLIISLIIALTRVLVGVHFIKDVTAGAIFSIIFGILFIFLI